MGIASSAGAARLAELGSRSRGLGGSKVLKYRVSMVPVVLGVGAVVWGMVYTQHFGTWTVRVGH